jgi:hypothetical protein
MMENKEASHHHFTYFNFLQFNSIIPSLGLAWGVLKILRRFNSLFFFLQINFFFHFHQLVLVFFSFLISVVYLPQFLNYFCQLFLFLYFLKLEFFISAIKFIQEHQSMIFRVTKEHWLKLINIKHII